MNVIKKHLSFTKTKTKVYLNTPLGKAAGVAIIVLAFGIAYFWTSGSANQEIARTASADSTFDLKIADCLKNSPDLRQECAHQIGTEVKTTFTSPAARLRECMKLRPQYDRYCQEALK